MLGAAIKYIEKVFVTHTTLHHSQSAVITFSFTHFLILFAFLLLCLIVILSKGMMALLSIIIISLTSMYFCDLVFHFLLITRSFYSNPQIEISKKELTARKKYTWPKYTIFCPLYKESSVLAQFVKAIKNLDYPKKKLEVMLLLEEDDKETIAAAKRMKLPSYFQVNIVPHSQPKTKPKAVNWGLNHSTGKYAVIFDAEDIPEPDQLKKSVIAFEKYVDPDTVCLQAKLNFYNPRQNILTRLFTGEYSLWFDLILPGLQSINAPIPLGGTSNHFVVDKLKELEGWDSFNVTEDCDLGVRIWRKGYKTAVLNSTTWEEANSRLKNWVRQRSRWIKGYMQTVLVQYKNPLSLYKENFNVHLLTFHLIVLGKVISAFVNPFLWLLTIVYFLFRPIIGDAIESLFPPSIYYFAVFSLVFGNFLYLYYMLLGLAQRKYLDIILYFMFIPAYWLMISWAAWVALIQLVTKPHYWEKTIHGLHLANNGKAIIPNFAQSNEK